MSIHSFRPLPSKSVLSLAIAGLLLGPGVQAATLTVDSTADPGDGSSCTLRQAIESIHAGEHRGGCVAEMTPDPYGSHDTILFDASVTGTIRLNGTELGITRSLRIQGPDAADLAVDGAGRSRVFDITGPGVEVSIDGLTIQNGSTSESGGGIAVTDASLVLSNSTLSGNSAAAHGGGLAALTSAVTLTNSSVSGNSAGTGGGLDAFDSASLTLTHSSVSGNTAGNYGGGLGAVLSAVTLTYSTLSGNSAGYFGGGLDVSFSASVTLTNSTLSGNSAGFEGGGLAAYDGSAVTLIHSTVSGNSADYFGGGLALSDSTVTLINSLLAGNNTDCERYDSTVTGSFNLIGSATFACGLTHGTDNNLVGVNPLIGPLADNGCMTPAGNPNGPPEFYGCVQTHALLPGSPALDAATASGAPATDQRGVARPQGAGVDIGAFELEREPDPAPIPALPLWGLLGGAGLLGLLGVWRGRRLPHGQRH